MKRYKRLLAVLGIEDWDRITIEYAATVSRMAQSEVVYFLYLITVPDLLPP